MESFLAIVLLFLSLHFGDSVQIFTKQGPVKGKIEKSRVGRDFAAFYGIPYAEPPVGDLRFEVRKSNLNICRYILYVIANSIL